MIDIMVPFGDNWCQLVTLMRTKNKRFTVSLSERDYRKLLRMANGHRPPLSLQYLVNWALQELFERSHDPQHGGEIGNPLRKRKR